ncbi:MAG: hypothetical protein DRP01_02445 [Archaeoglobales archaeon]|nr:MAG: hypothetical protein DRP01_02445 [Archaeoglobales archaeon]
MGALKDRPASVIPVPYGHITVWTDEEPFHTYLYISVVRQNRAIEHTLSPRATASLLQALASKFMDQLAREHDKINDRIKEMTTRTEELEKRMKEAPEGSSRRKYYEDMIAEAKECLETLEARRASIERAQYELKVLMDILTDLAETDAI